MDSRSFTNEKADIEEREMGHLGADRDAYGRSTLVIDQAASNKLRNKIDLHIVPIVAILYLFCFIDRANIGNARLAGLETDLGLTGYDYNTVLSVFYVSYIVFEIPSNILCKIVGPGRYIPLLTFLFGLFSLCTAFCNSFAAILVVRFLMGVAEAGMLPGIAYYLSRWYTRDELVFRLALYIAMAPFAGAFGGLLASGILTISSIGSVTRWQMIFLVEGIITIGLAVIAFFILTDRPSVAKWLSPEEKTLAENRILSQNAGMRSVLDTVKSGQVKQGIFSVSTLTISLIFLFDNITVQGVSLFTPTIIRTIYPTYTTVQQQLQTVPPYIVGTFMTLFVPFLSWKFGRRGIFLIISAPFMIAGYAMYLGTTNPQVRYAGSFLIMSGAFSFGALCNAWAAANVASDTARASSIATVVMFGNCGGLIATWSFLPSDAPNYPRGNGLNLATSTCILFLSIGLVLYQTRQNKIRDSQQAEGEKMLRGMSEEEQESLGIKHPAFRFAL